MTSTYHTKNIACSALLLAAMITSSHPVMADTMTNIDKAHGTCLESGIGDDPTFQRCSGDRTEQLQKLNRAMVKELKLKYSPEKDEPPFIAEHKKAALLHVQKEQKAWEAYEKMACNNLADSLIYGTAGQNIFAPDCHARVIKQRIQTIHEELCAGGEGSSKYCE